MLTLKNLENVDDGDSWQKLMKAINAVTNNEKQWLSKLTEIVSESLTNRLVEEPVQLKKMIIEQKGTKRCFGTGSKSSSVEEEKEKYLIRKQMKQEETGDCKKQTTGIEKKQKRRTVSEKKQKQRKSFDPLVQLTALGLEPPADSPEVFKNRITMTVKQVRTIGVTLLISIVWSLLEGYKQRKKSQAAAPSASA
ncbi:hypothetical protein QQP08_017767 [Theobroma cacao]|nr:hypothetical protein QQP08_017767 [Theobroma cacao]